MKIKTQLFAIIFSVILITGIATTLTSLNVAKKIIDNFSNQALHNIINRKKDSIENFLKIGRSLNMQLAASEGVKQSLILDKKGIEYKVIDTDVRETLQNSAATNEHITDIFILNKDGMVTYSNIKERIGLNNKNTDLFGKEVQVLYVHNAISSLLIKAGKNLFITSPIVKKGGERLGVLVTQYHLDFLKELVADRRGLGKTGEIHLVHDDSCMFKATHLSEHSTSPGSIVGDNMRNFISKLKLSEKKLGEGRLNIFKNWAGRKVVGAYTEIPDIEWTIVGAQTAEETFSPVTRLTVKLSLILILFLVAGTLLSHTISKGFTAPIVKLKGYVDSVREGGKPEKLVMQGTGEIEDLSRSFQETLGELEEYKKEMERYNTRLEADVEKRTAELSRKRLDSLLAAQDLKKANKELKTIQAQMLQSEKMASIGQLAAGVAHEINNPTGFVSSNLNTLIGYQADINKLIEEYRKMVVRVTELNSQEQIDGLLTEELNNILALESELDIDYLVEDISNLIKESKDGTDRIRKIVSDLKNFAHPGDDKLQLANINQNIKSTLNVVWNELKYKCRVSKELDPALPEIECYPQQLNQVIMNILVNSAQAIEEKGEIKVETKMTDDHIEIRIGDTGKGIPAKSLKKIFDPFFTTKPVGKGTGLGLNIAYNIIQKHDGTIDVESEVGKGTTFIIKLPLTQKKTDKPLGEA